MPSTNAARRVRQDTGVTLSWRPELSNVTGVLCLVPLAAVVALLILYPLGKLAWSSISTGDGMGNYVSFLSSSSGRRALITTLASSALVAVLSVSIGAVLAWYLAHNRHSWLKALLWCSVLVPFWMGTVVKSYAFILLFGRTGPINAALGWFGLGEAQLLYTPYAVVIGMVYTMVPYAVLSVYSVMNSVDISLVAAARSLGATRWQAIRSVALPLTINGLLASAALVFAISLGFYVTPVLLGGAQTPFMASLIQDSVLTFFDYPTATAAATLLLLAAVLSLGVAALLVGKKRLLGAMV